ncbi:MAG: hypothetical protein JXR97_11745 [Planctomycetes bacterium]|nr:hypothetical protein [Planctomycetota bacterium]
MKMQSQDAIVVISSRAPDEEAPSAMLLRRGFNVFTVTRQDELAGQINSRKPDLILFDLFRNEEDVEKKIEWLRGIKGGAMCSIIVLVDSCTHEDRMRFLECGVNGIIQLPIDADELCATVNVHLEATRLRKELASRNAELEDKTADLAHLIDLKNRFLDLATHDIRTPITTMKLVSNVIDKLVGDMPGFDRIEKPMDILARNIARIEAKIDEFMLIAKLDLRRMILDLGPVNLNDIVRDAISSFFANAISRGIDLDASLNEIPLMRGDARKLTQLAFELIETSIDRLDSGGRILVKTRPEGDGVWLRVTDNGVPMEAGAPTRLLGGMENEVIEGDARVPLYNAYRIARAHGGRLLIASDENAGTLFAAWVPLVAVVEQEAGDE